MDVNIWSHGAVVTTATANDANVALAAVACLLTPVHDQRFNLEEGSTAPTTRAVWSHAYLDGNFFIAIIDALICLQRIQDLLVLVDGTTAGTSAGTLVSCGVVEVGTPSSRDVPQFFRR